MKIVYIDGIFDLFHRGHLESLKQAKNIFEDCFLLVGVISDEVAKSYKREPIINEDDRIEIIRSLDIVDKVIENPPLIITEEFINTNNIDLVVHSFKDENDWEKQKYFFDSLIKINKFKKINYYNQTSTTDIIDIIKKNH